MSTETHTPASVDRVPANTAEEVNRRIAWETECRVAHCAEHPQAIDRRLRELDREWTIERAIEANAAAFSLAGLALGTTRPVWRLLPLAVASFLLQHAVQGWCPPVPVLRRLGYRTAAEIARERTALKALRGDFETLGSAGGSPHQRAARALQAAKS